MQFQAGDRSERDSGSNVSKRVRQYRDGGEEALAPKRKLSNPLTGYENNKAPSEVEQLRHELAAAYMRLRGIDHLTGFVLPCA